MMVSLGELCLPQVFFVPPIYKNINLGDHQGLELNLCLISL